MRRYRSIGDQWLRAAHPIIPAIWSHVKPLAVVVNAANAAIARPLGVFPRADTLPAPSERTHGRGRLTVSLLNPLE